MTTIFPRSITCVNCGHTSEQLVVGSTNMLGSPDLDLRPASMQRDTMHLWLQLCPQCGYTARDLAVACRDMAVVSGPEYRAALKDERMPALARRFLAHAVLISASDANGTALVRLWAAWACDDEAPGERAIECRRLAARSFSVLKPFLASKEGMGAVYVDVLRRAGEFQRAAKECDELLARKTVAGVLREVLELEARLITAQDTAAHTLDEL